MSQFFSSKSHQQPVDNARNQQPLVTLRILKGQTQYRTRHVFKNRYLIGSDQYCDLQLGDSSIPKLHSILLFNGRTATFEAIADSPKTLINHQSQIEATLIERDIITIGNFEMQIEQIADVDSETAETTTRIDSLSNLPAIELVNQMQSELKTVERIEKQKQLGAAALMAAIQSAGPTSPAVKPAVTVQGDEGQIAAQIEQIIDSLQDLSQELDQRAEQISRREQQYLSAAAELLNSQQYLSGQLETLADHIPQLIPHLRRHRASA